MGTDAQKCDIFRDMGGQEGPVQETARGTDVLQRGCQSPHLAGTLSQDTAGQPRGSPVPSKGESALLPTLTSLKPAKVPLLHLYLHWSLFFWCLWATALSKVGGEHGGWTLEESCDRMKENQNSAAKWELLAMFSLGEGWQPLHQGFFSASKCVKVKLWSYKSEWNFWEDSCGQCKQGLRQLGFHVSMLPCAEDFPCEWC